MKNSTTIIIVASLLGTLGVGTFIKVFYDSQPPPPVAIMPQHKQKIQMPKNLDSKATDDEILVNNHYLPASLSKVRKYSETIYEMAKLGEWKDAKANISLLEDAAKSLSSEIKDGTAQLANLNFAIREAIAKLNQAVTAKNCPVAMSDANQVKLIAAKIAIQFQPKS